MIKSSLRPLLPVLLLLFCLSRHSAALAQGENNNWHFGYHAAITFNQSPPVAVSGSNLYSVEGCASVSGPAGNLKFYSSGTTIYDRNGNVMPNGSGLLGNQPGSGFTPLPGSASQGVNIVQFPSDTSKYYHFVLDAGETWPAPGYLRYSIIDMTLNGGLGDVVAGQKNIVLQDSMTEAAITIRGDGCYTWLLVHNRFLEEFLAYKIDINGLDTTPVRSYSGVLANYGFSGCMAVSPDRSKLFYFGYETLEYHEFDPATGIVFNGVALDTAIGHPFYAGAVSPDGSKLYSCRWSGFLLHQYDLSLLPNIAAVAASRYTLSSAGYYSDARLGPDNKIYLSQTGSHYVSTIHNPNGLGASAQFQMNAVYLGSLTPYPTQKLGSQFVINYIDTFHAPALDTGTCFLSPFTVSAPPGYSEYHWSDGLAGTSRTLTGPDTLWLISTNGCNIRVDSFKIHSIPLTQIQQLHDTAICFSTPTYVSAPPGFQTYLWNDNSASISHTLTGPDTLWVISTSGCTTRTDTFKVSAIPVVTTTFRTDTAICFPASVIFSAPVGYTSYLWHDATTLASNSFSAPVVAWVKSEAACQIRIDTFEITQAVFKTTALVDTTLCLAAPVTLTATPGYTSYTWNDNSTGPTNQIITPGSYSVTGVLGCNAHVDSFIVHAALNDSLILTHDTIACFTEQLTLTGPAGYLSYFWSDSSQSVTHVVNHSGDYILTSGRDCEIRIDSFNVQLINFDVSLGNDSVLCLGDDIMLTAFALGSTYQWQDGSTNADYLVTSPGSYHVQVNNNGCLKSDTVSFEEKQISLFLGNDTTICEKDILLLQPEHEGILLWQDGGEQPSFEISAPGVYTATNKLSACMVTDTIVVNYQLCECAPFIPSAFTPNGDGRNDVFGPLIDCPHNYFKMLIINRWGQVVFSTNSPMAKWDGTFESAPAEGGVYHYMIQFIGPLYKNYFFKGDITLIR